MNQILATQVSKQKEKNSGKMSTQGVVRFFAIAILIFGLLIAGGGTYAFISGRKNVESNTQVTVDRMGNQAVIKVSSQMPINALIYNWNGNEDNRISGNGSISMEQSIKIPSGNNTLNIRVVDYYGKETKYHKEYYVTNSDTQKPELKVNVTGNTLKVVATDNVQLSYLLYKWNDEEETVVEAKGDDLTTIEETIPVKKGENTLTITVVDTSNNTETRTQKYKGANKPTITLQQDGGFLLIQVKDEEGIDKVTYKINGKQFSTGDQPLNIKEGTIRQALDQGENIVEVTVISISGLSDTQMGKCTY